MTGPVPAEWAPHAAMWVGFPSHPELWQEDLAPAQQEVADLARALAGPGAERVRLLASGAQAAATARELLAGVAGVEVVEGAFGDVWLRDTGPIFLTGGEAAAFAFNGWGGKYVLEGDETVAEQIAGHAGAGLTRWPFVLEGGAIDHDGAGTVLTTRQCLLNDNRNPGWTRAIAETALGEALGAQRVVWAPEGLAGDHTDGHVDNLARFVAPGMVACPLAYGQDDPNAAVFDAAAQALARAGLSVRRIPSPGRVEDEDGEAAPASHMNFVIANGAVIVPLYRPEPGRLALEALTQLFPGRQVIGLASNALLSGGGSFHCITQQEPAR